MSSLKDSTCSMCLARSYKRLILGLGITLATVSLSANVMAACVYTVTNQWGSGYQATVKVSNTTSAAVNNWTVSWQYAGSSRITNLWNGTLTGTNPYTVTNANWNGGLQPGQTAEFGLQGTQSVTTPEVPTISGTLCSSAPASSSSSSSSLSSSLNSSSSLSSSSSSSVNSSSSANSSSSNSTAASWNLNTTKSYLYFVTTKNTNTVEAHKFDTLSGGISAEGEASLVINLVSVNTANATRDQRVRDLLFETGTFPLATVSVALDTTVITGMTVGTSNMLDITANLNLHGVNALIMTQVLVQKLSASQVMVQSTTPLLIKVADHSLDSGIEALRTIAGLTSISTTVPVDFVLFFDAK